MMLVYHFEWGLNRSRIWFQEDGLLVGVVRLMYVGWGSGQVR